MKINFPLLSIFLFVQMVEYLFFGLLSIVISDVFSFDAFYTFVIIIATDLALTGIFCREQINLFLDELFPED